MPIINSPSTFGVTFMVWLCPPKFMCSGLVLDATLLRGSEILKSFSERLWCWWIAYYSGLRKWLFCVGGLGISRVGCYNNKCDFLCFPLLLCHHVTSSGLPPHSNAAWGPQQVPSRCWCHMLGLPSLPQNHEPNKPWFVINHPVLDILLYQQKIE